jgi:type II secretory ATPase GspE/PulE/Tfp pilus assembly ATPase PilB-like protein
VEITQDGLRQVQVNRKAGLDFVAVMRAFLRADPDIIMVGEMRDAETAGTGIEASLTGHLVMSTLHTNSAVESVIRLLDMGMDPFNFADALLGILAQRLARRLCKECKEAYEPSAAEVGQLLDEFCTELTHTPAWKADPKAARQAVADDWGQKFTHEGRYRLYRAKGCPACQDTGYRGRIALHELLVASDDLKVLIQERAKVPDILAVALGEGMRTLKMDGLEKVMQGITDVHRVREVCIK